MRLWTNVLTPQDLHEAARAVNHEHPGCELYVNDAEVTGTRSRRFEKARLYSVTGTRRPNFNTDAPSWEMAASWTEWGWWLAILFERDPDMRANNYRGREAFHKQTGQRFRPAGTPRERQVRRVMGQMDRVAS